MRVVKRLLPTPQTSPGRRKLLTGHLAAMLLLVALPLGVAPTAQAATVTS